MLGPSGMPAALVTRVSAEIAKVLKSPDVVERLTVDGGEPVASTPEQFRQHLAAEITRWKKVVKDAGLRIE